MKKLSVLPYGAVELKGEINISTVKGFLISLTFFAIMGLIPFIMKTIVNDKVESEIVDITQTIELINIKIKETLSNNVQSSNPIDNSKIIGNVDVTKSSNMLTKNIIPVDIVTNDLKIDFEDNNLLAGNDIFESNSQNTGSNSNLSTGKKSGANKSIVNDEDFNKGYNFKSVEKIPGMDYEKLKSTVKYPQIAIEMNLSGVVQVAALIDKSGKLAKSYIYMSSNTLFEQEALRAVRNYNDFSPAFQNETAVDCWVIIPIKFKIK